MMRRFLLSAVAAAATFISASAMPAVRELISYVQPDGSVVELYLRGDERSHYYVTKDGDVAMADGEGFIRYASIGADGILCAGSHRIDRPVASAERIKADLLAGLDAQLPVMMRQAPGEIQPTFPTTGTIRGLIILVEYQDVKMSELSTHEHYEKMLNGENYTDGRIVGSVRDYFVSQSGGLFTPEFDVVGPVTLPHERAYYGMTENYIDHMRDACMAADKDADVDFTRYDANDDGFVDFVFLVYAGHGEAQGGSPESVWPAMMDYTNGIYDYFDGLNLSVGACSCELSGSENADPALDGIGTICHEFSHILGLPDIYDPTYGSGYGMGHFDLLDSGGYNGSSFVPACFTAMDRYYVGWLEPKVLEGNLTDVSLAPLSESGEAYFIVNPDNENEYYTLENRQWKGWDASIPGHGLVISRITYNPTLWARNTVNAPNRSGLYEHVKIMAADNVWVQNYTDTPQGTGSEAGDPFPGSKDNREFSTETLPRALWMSTTDTPCKFAVTNIREQEDGTLLFDFTSDTSGIDNVASEGETLCYDRERRVLRSAAETELFTLAGTHMASYGAGENSLENLPDGIYVAVSGDKSVKIIKQ